MKNVSKSTIWLVFIIIVILGLMWWRSGEDAAACVALTAQDRVPKEKVFWCAVLIERHK